MKVIDRDVNRNQHLCMKVISKEMDIYVCIACHMKKIPEIKIVVHQLLLLFTILYLVFVYE
jgi:hypothetical protein